MLFAKAFLMGRSVSAIIIKVVFLLLQFLAIPAAAGWGKTQLAVANNHKFPLHSQIRFENNNFQQSVVVEFESSVQLAKIRQAVLDAHQIAIVSEWVSDAAYTDLKNSGQKNFFFKMGKFGFYYTHRFLCQENLTMVSWQIDCNAIDSQNPEDQVMYKGFRAVTCEVKDKTVCEFAATGELRKIVIDLKIKTETINASRTAFELFVEETNYVAHLMLIASGRAPDIKVAAAQFESSPYAELIKKLREKKSEFKNTNFKQLNFPQDLYATSQK